MARDKQTRAKRTPSFNDPPEPDQPPLDVDEDSDDNADLFPSDDEEGEDEGEVPDYDEAADEAEPPFKRDDDPEFREREAAIGLYKNELGFNRSVALSLYRDQGLDSAQGTRRRSFDLRH